MAKTLLFFLTILGLPLVCGRVPMLTPMLAAQSVAVADEGGIQHPPVPRLGPESSSAAFIHPQSEGSSFVVGAQGLAKPKPYRFRSVDYPGAGASGSEEPGWGANI